MTTETAIAENKKPFFMAQNTGLGQVRPEDELLHPESFKNVTDDSATETQYFGFCVPEARIHAICYLWHHPNLRVCSGGITVYQGVKDTQAQAELLDWRTFMRDSALANDLHDYRLDNGYGVQVLEPNKRLHITYNDTARQNSVDLIVEAVLPAVMWGDGNHFEQAMRVKGKLSLRGKAYDVDCFTVRDRSWGKPRPEALMPMPPMSWMVGTFSLDFAFNCTVFDQARNNPLLKGSMALPIDKTLSGGWVYRNGKVGRIVQADKRVIRGPKSLAVSGVELTFSDEHGRKFDMRGSLVASCPIFAWNNVTMVINLMRWECDGLVSYSDMQEAFWGDYHQLLNAR